MSNSAVVALFVILFAGAISFGFVTHSIGSGIAFFSLLVALLHPRQ